MPCLGPIKYWQHRQRAIGVVDAKKRYQPIKPPVTEIDWLKVVHPIRVFPIFVFKLGRFVTAMAFGESSLFSLNIG